MLHCYCVDTCELRAISIKSEHLIVPFSNNLAVEFDLLKATNKIALEDFLFFIYCFFFSFKATYKLLISNIQQGSQTRKYSCCLAVDIRSPKMSTWMTGLFVRISVLR